MESMKSFTLLASHCMFQRYLMDFKKGRRVRAYELWLIRRTDAIRDLFIVLSSICSTTLPHEHLAMLTITYTLTTRHDFST
jgi:hypothetical protein